MTSAFEETTFSFSDKAPPPPGERRQQARHLTILRVGTLISEDDRELCLVRNISAGGLMAHVYSAYQSDQRIAVELKHNQQRPGTVPGHHGSTRAPPFHPPTPLSASPPA